MRSDPTPPTIAEDGWESHPSWVSIRVNHSSCSPPGAQLVDSEILHQHIVTVQLHGVQRKRDLNRDRWMEREQLFELHMSAAQWGGFVSSFGQGSAQPVTLDRIGKEYVPQEERCESRLSVSMKEVGESAHEGMAEVVNQIADLEVLFESNATRKEMRQAIRDLTFKARNLPLNMEFAVKSLAEATENVVQKARADVEAMVVGKAAALGIELDAGDVIPQLGPAE